MKNLLQLTALSLMATALITLPVSSRAQAASTPAPAPTTVPATVAPATLPVAPATNTPPVVKKKHGALPFHGTLAAVDAPAGTFSVGKLTLNITSTTKISTNAVPATLADFKVGDYVTGAYKKAADGTLNATSLKLGTPNNKKTAAE